MKAFRKIDSGKEKVNLCLNIKITSCSFIDKHLFSSKFYANLSEFTWHLHASNKIERAQTPW